MWVFYDCDGSAQLNAFVNIHYHMANNAMKAIKANSCLARPHTTI